MAAAMRVGPKMAPMSQRENEVPLAVSFRSLNLPAKPKTSRRRPVARVDANKGVLKRKPWYKARGTSSAKATKKMALPITEGE